MATFHIEAIAGVHRITWGLFRDAPPASPCLLTAFGTEVEAQTYAERLRSLERIKGTA